MSKDSGNDKPTLPKRSPALEKLLGRSVDSSPKTATSGGAAATPAPITETNAAPKPGQSASGSSVWELETLRNRLKETQEEIARLRIIDDSHSRLLTLLEANADFLVSADPARLPDRILQIGLDLVGAERAAFFRISKEGALNLGQVRPEGATFSSISHSVVRDALLGKRTIVHQGQSAQVGAERQSIIDLDLETVVATPLMTAERQLGILYLDGSRVGAFTAADVPVLEIFTRLAAAAMVRLEELQEVREEKSELKQENMELKSALSDRTRFGNILAASAGMKNVIEQLRRMCRYRSTVRIFGETGTGKELIARALHNESAWARRPFVTINCGAIPEALLESELFGHEKGAFTGADTAKAGLFEQADGGSLFLDEIGDMPAMLQVKLLRVLENGEVRRVGGNRVSRVDVRVIAASHRNLEERVRDGEFREDLFYRLNVLTVSLPPLRERPEDVELLAEYFLKRYGEKMGQDCRGFTPAAIGRLQSETWPGNVRQLEKCVERSLAHWEGRRIMEEHQLMLDAGPLTDRPDLQATQSSPDESLKQFVTRMEKDKIGQALKQAKGRKTTAAARLGISRQYLHRKIKDLELE
ncbi:MAG: GAF domain-containing protein [bacterium]|nr:GAF domain-containing protein [bacterium]